MLFAGGGSIPALGVNQLPLFYPAEVGYGIRAKTVLHVRSDLGCRAAMDGRQDINDGVADQ
jgi:hypothetical protein